MVVEQVYQDTPGVAVAAVDAAFASAVDVVGVAIGVDLPVDEDGPADAHAVAVVVIPFHKIPHQAAHKRFVGAVGQV